MKEKKRGYIFKLAIDVIARRLGLFTLTIFLAIASFSLIYAVFMLYVDYGISDMVLEGAVNYNQDESYELWLSVYSDDLENVNNFIKELSNQEGITVGRIQSFKMDGFDTQTYFIDSGYASYNKLTSGGKPLNFSLEEGSDYPIYVGSKMAEKYPVGSSFLDGDETYIVKGIIDDNQLMIVEPIGNQLFDSVPSENLVVGLSKEDWLSNNMYIFSELPENEVRESIIKVAKEFEYGFVLQSVGDYLEQIHTSELESARIVIVLGYILMAVTFVVVCVVSISSVFLNSPMYAVLYAFGYDHKDMYRIIMLENGVRVIISLISAYSISSLYTSVTYSKSYINYIGELVIRKHAMYGGLLMLVLGLAVFIVSTVLPVFFYKRMSVTEILKCKE